MSRRAFLKFSAAVGAAALLRPALASTPVIASTLPLPIPHLYFPNAETLLASAHRSAWVAFDLLLVPAYVAAELIRQGLLQTLAGVGRDRSLPGRAHDPEGAFTIPYTGAVAGLVYRGQPPRSLEDLWGAEALWPDSARLVIGAALLRRGYPLNATHPGHLAQVEADLLKLRPRLAPDPARAVRAGRAALALAPISELGNRANVFLPPEGAALIEYDWAIPLGAPHSPAGLSFVEHAPIYNWQSALANSPAPLIPLTPLPAAAHAQRAEIWARVKRAAR